MTSSYIIAVHGGAGFHDHASEKTVKQALKAACSRALKVLKAGGDSLQAGGGSLQAGGDSLQAVRDAIVSMEDDGCLNAGYGSNLTIEGTVECDASIMDGITGDFGAVGAVSGVKNPISVALAVLRNASNNERHPMGLVPPMILCGEGARLLAQRSQLPTVSPAEQISQRAKMEWELWKQKLIHMEDSLHLRPNENMGDGYNLFKQDTVGAVSCDGYGNTAAGVSSGGLLLKQSGRLGEASIYGAGCWAHSAPNQPGMACSVSGTGEQIIRTSLAQKLGEALNSEMQDDPHAALHSTIHDKFSRMCSERGDLPANAGVLLLTKDANVEEGEHQTCRLWCAFTTESMAVAYASSLDEKPKAVIIRRPAKPATGSQLPLFVTKLSLTR